MRIATYILAVTLTIALSIPSACRAGGWVDDWLNQRTVTAPNYFEGQKRGFYSAGSFNARWRNTSNFPITVEMPRIKSGCGGIDVFLGGFSFMKFEYLVQKLQRVLMSAGAVAFDLALKTLCEPCSTTIKSIDALANQLNSMQLDECAAGKELVAVLDDGSGGFASMDTISRRLSTALKENKLSQGIADLYQSITEADRANKNVPQTADVKRAVSGCHADIKQIVLSNLANGGGSLLDNLGVNKMGLAQSYVDLIRGLVGDILVSGPDTAFMVTYIPPCPQNNANDIGAFLDGTVIAKNSSGTCYQITDANRDLTNYVQTVMNSIAARIRTKSSPTASQQAFLQGNPLSPLPVLKAAVASNTEAATIAVMSELTAKAYALQMLSDLYARAQAIAEKAKELLGKKAVAATGQDSENCNAAIFGDNLDKEVAGMMERINRLQFAARDSYTASAKEMTTIMDFLRHMQRAEQKLYEEITRRYGDSLASRLRES